MSWRDLVGFKGSGLNISLQIDTLSERTLQLSRPDFTLLSLEFYICSATFYIEYRKRQIGAHIETGTA